MVGKSELAVNHVLVSAPTQEQIRIAQITQDSTTFDGEKAAFQKLVRQVMEAAKCNQNTAEIALFDSGNNVEDAILAIIEGDTKSWTESKNRKAKKSDVAQEEKENFVDKRERGGNSSRGERRKRGGGEGGGRPERGDRKNRDLPERENRGDREIRDGGDRPERFERGERGNRLARGGGRGTSGATRGGRGGGGYAGSGRGGGSARPPKREDREREQGGESKGGFSVTTWDNNMQNNKEDDVFNGDNEELNWSNTPLVFSRREPQQHHSQSQQQPQPSVQTYNSVKQSQQQPESGKPMSFAAAAARKKVEVIQPAPGPIEPPQRSYEKECQPSPSVSPQKSYQQQSSIFGNSGSSFGKDLSLDGGPIDGLGRMSRGSANDQIGGLTFTNRAHVQQVGGYADNTVQNLTNQLKNDLGISISTSSGATTASNVANLLSSFQSSSTGDASKAQSAQQQQRYASTPQANFNSSTVEFVTGGGDVVGGGGSTLDYQFGWGATEASPTAGNDVDSYKQNSYLASANAHQEISPKRLEIDHALSKLNHIDVSSAKSTAQSTTNQSTAYGAQTNGQSQQQAQTQQQQQGQDPLNKLRAGSTLSYVNTSSLNYPGTATTKSQNQSQHILTITDPNTQRQTQLGQQPVSQQANTQAQGYAQQQQQQAQHHQQVQQSPAQQPQQQQTQQQQQMSQAPLYPQAQNFAAYTNPYMNSYMNMNLYSPVTASMRTDDAAVAATFLGYPFINQMDLASLTSMLPPMASATASTAQAPPTMQSHLQHQQHTQPGHAQARSDQGHYDMPKNYSNQNLGAVTMANTTNLAQGQGQRSTMDTSNNSAVPPPPGFTGPPSNIPAATALFQPNLSSLFQMPGSYAPNLSPFPLMFPGSTPQHKIQTMFPQQTLDDTMNMNDIRMGNQQKIYGQGQQQDKYSVPNGGAKERGLNMGGAQPTPPPQISGNYAPAYSGMQNMGLHKKNQYHWNN